MVANWLKFNIAVPYGDEFTAKLLDLKQRYNRLHFRACQILTGTNESEVTVVRYAIYRLMDLHYGHCRQFALSLGRRPERRDMPEAMREVDELLEEHDAIRNACGETADYLFLMSQGLRAKIAASPVAAAQIAESKRNQSKATQATPTKKKVGKKPSPAITHFLDFVAMYSDNDDAAVLAYRTTHTQRANKLATSAAKLKRKLQRWRSARRSVNGHGNS